MANLLKYGHLEVNKGDRVKITIAHPNTGLPYTAEGPVLSAYSAYVYAPGTSSGIENMIGWSPEGIEMHDDLRGGNYGYWKCGDGGRVWKLVGEEWVQVYPIQFEGVVT